MASYRYLTGTVVPVGEDGGGAITEHLPRCFGCGSDNVDGLGLRPHYQGDFVTADLQFPARFEGGPGLVHGGAIAAFFDDLLGFVPMAHLRPGVTAKLDVNYLRPVPLGLSIRGRAWMADIDGSKMWAEGVGGDESGRRYVEARALFVSIGPDHFAKALQDHRYESDEYYP